MADTPFVWDDLAQYKAEGRFPGRLSRRRKQRSFAPRTTSTACPWRRWAAHSTPSWLTCLGYDDDELNKIIQGKLAGREARLRADEPDRSQGPARVHEKQILAS